MVYIIPEMEPLLPDKVHKFQAVVENLNKIQLYRWLYSSIYFFLYLKYNYKLHLSKLSSKFYCSNVHTFFFLCFKTDDYSNQRTSYMYRCLNVKKITVFLGS